MTNTITRVIHYRDQPEMLKRHTQDPIDGVTTVIIDDCSDEPLTPEQFKGAKIARIEDKIQWNNAGAKNLGAHISQGWILFLEIDHTITAEDLRKLTTEGLQKENAYYLPRIDAGTKNELAHSLSCVLIHKDLFDSAGGFDEDFSGNYGFEDLEFFNRISMSDTESLPYPLTDWSTDPSIPDAYVKEYRNLATNSALYIDKISAPSKPTKNLRFKWTMIA